MSDRESAVEPGGSGDEGLISRFWKAPPPPPDDPEPLTPPEPEGEPD